MTSPFYSFYDTAVNGSTKQVDWKKLEQQFRIKDKRYPSSKQILHYYSQDFSNSALKGSRCKWHSMDKLLFLWVVVKYCELYNRCIHKLHVIEISYLEARFRKIFGDFASSLWVARSQVGQVGETLP